MQEYFDTQIEKHEEKEEWQVQLTTTSLNEFDTFVQSAEGWADWPE